MPCKRQQHRRASIAAQFDATFEQRNLRAIGKLAHIEARALSFQKALSRVHFEGLRGRQEDFAFEQADQSLRTVDVHGTGGIELQLITATQGNFASLPQRAAVIGKQ
ncbi:hypothetical protein D3C81_1824130 [compost metagenome]